VDTARAARWLWHDPAALPLRAALLPAAGLFRAAVAVRNAAYDVGLLGRRPLPAPAIGVGNLAVGGTGKTPVSAFLVAALAERGCRPAVVLRGYGGDEAEEHAERPGAIVEADPDRMAAAVRAVAGGADCLVLDDCLQRRDIAPDLMVAVVAAETWAGPRWPLPAGPWREGIGALARADLVLVTARTAPEPAAAALGAALAPRTRAGGWITAVLEPVSLRPLAGGPAEPVASLAGRDVVAVCGIGEPGLFADQLRRTGALVRLLAFGDHHPYTARDVRAIIDAAARRGVAVTTAKDAVKLRRLWPTDGPLCLVAELTVRITGGADVLGAALDRVATAARAPRSLATAAPPARRS
jgi:tetraacyldisaccharide 4'-kinase